MQVRLNFLSMYKKSSFRLKFLCTYTYNNFCLSHQEYLCPKYIKETSLAILKKVFGVIVTILFRAKLQNLKSDASFMRMSGGNWYAIESLAR